MSNVYEIVTEKILKALEQGVAPWRRPWTSVSAPKNLVSGKEYRGINVWLLGLSGQPSPYWVTFKQALELGGHVRKGEHGTLVVFYRTIEKANPQDEANPKRIPLLRYYTVFNVAQCEGLKHSRLEAEAPAPVDPIAAAEAIVAGMPNPPAIQHGTFDHACYYPGADRIELPERSRFTGSPEYYGTLFHELSHSTGHSSRLDRREPGQAHRFGDPAYSREELVAEMSAAFLCNAAGIEDTLPNNAAYLQSWMNALRGDSRLVVAAASAAQKSADYILGAQASDQEA